MAASGNWMKSGPRRKWHRIRLLFESGYASTPCGLMFHISECEIREDSPDFDRCGRCW